MTKAIKFKVAVYGSLRKGLSNHKLVSETKFLGKFETPPKYTMFSVGASFPGLVQRGTTSVMIEVYEVNKIQLKRIDILEGFKENAAYNHYERFEIDTPYGKAYCYEYNNSTATLPRVDSGDWTAFKKDQQKFKK